MSRLEVDLFDPPPDPDLLCAICQCVLSNPTESSTCRHVFCHKCITTWLNSGARTCPTCRAAMTSYDLRRALPALCNVIGRLVMQCVNHTAGCSTRLPVERLETHLRTDCQWVLERCECGTELLRRDLEAHKDVCVCCVFPCSKCDLMITTRERNTHNCFLALKQAISGQKYLLKELRRHLEQGTSLSQQLQSQLASFDRQTRNYSPSLTTELPPSTQNYTSVPLEVAFRYAPDVLVALSDDEPFNSSASRTANSVNQHVPVAEARQSEENGAGTSFQSLSPTYYSADESQASGSPNADDNRMPSDFSDVDDDEEFDATDEVDESNTAEFDEYDEMDEYSNDESFVDDDFHSRGYQEYFDSDDHSEASVRPEEAYTDSENDSHNSRRADSESTNRPRRALQDVEEGDNYNDGHGDVLQTDGTTASLQAAGDEHADDGADGSAHASTGDNTAGLSEHDRTPLRLRLNVSDAGSRYQDVSRGFSDDVSGDEDDAVSRDDASDDQSSDGDSNYNYYYRQSPRRHRSSSSSTSTSASPSLHGDDDADEDEVLSPADVHDVDDDADARCQNSGDNAEASSERRNLHSRSDTERDENHRPVSRASSSASSRSSVYEHRRGASSGSESDGSWLASDTSADSDDSSSESAAHRRGVKRQRSVGSATDSDADQRRHKLHRFR